MCADMYVGMCTDMGADMCVDVYAGMCADMRADMLVYDSRVCPCTCFRMHDGAHVRMSTDMHTFADTDICSLHACVCGCAYLPTLKPTCSYVMAINMYLRVQVHRD
jgi:hypothetical protein